MKAQTTDLTPRMPFPVNPGWYESCWYGDRPASRRTRLAGTLRKTRTGGLTMAKIVPVVIGRAARRLGQITAAH